MNFLMQPQKEGRVRYLLLTFLPPFLTSQLIPGIPGKIISLVLLCVLGYFLILTRNHTIEVGDLSILEKDWRGNTKLILPQKIHFWQENALGELLLMDETGKAILRAEPNLSNQKLLELWLTSHNINKKE